MSTHNGPDNCNDAPSRKAPPPAPANRPQPQNQQAAGNTNSPATASKIIAPPSKKPPPTLFPSAEGQTDASPESPSHNGMSPSPGASQRSNSPAATATLRDMVYGTNGGPNTNNIDFTAVAPRDEGEGILDQPITTPTARTPVKRTNSFSFNYAPKSPSGPHAPSSPCSRQHLNLVPSNNPNGLGQYPPMPPGFDSPCDLPTLVTIRQLDIPPPSRSMQEHKDSNNGRKEVSGGVIENRVCRDMVLKNVELRGCHVTNCALTDCVIKGGYHSGCRYSNCDIVNAHCVVSCVLDRTFTTLCILTNCLFRQGGVKESRIMDCILRQVGVFYCRLTRCLLNRCEYSDIEQIECPFSDCTPDGDINQYFEPPKKPSGSSRSSSPAAGGGSNEKANDKAGNNGANGGDKNAAGRRSPAPDGTSSQGSPVFDGRPAREGKVGGKKGSITCCT